MGICQVGKGGKRRDTLIPSEEQRVGSAGQQTYNNGDRPTRSQDRTVPHDEEEPIRNVGRP